MANKNSRESTSFVVSNKICDHKAGLTRKLERKTDANYITTNFKLRAGESTTVAGRPNIGKRIVSLD